MRCCISILLGTVWSLSAHSFNWHDLWTTPDQQGKALMTKSQFKRAKETFTRRDWAAAAAYRAGDYQQAHTLYQDLKSEEGYYNLGNSLAHMGQYEHAIKAYDKALAINATNQDALYNRKLIENLLKKDKEKNKEQQNKEQQNKEQQNKEQQKEPNNMQDQSEASREKKRAKEQWFRLIPDDPGGLMREKFLRDHVRRKRGWYQ